VRNDRQLFLRAAGDDKLQDFAFARSQSMGALIAAMSNRAVPIAVQILGGGPGQSWFGPDEWRLRVRNHGAVVGPQWPHGSYLRRFAGDAEDADRVRVSGL
jgi:hypothetical protein